MVSSASNDYRKAIEGGPSHRDLAQQMESLLIALGEQENRRLTAGVPARETSVALDETFHPDICSVRMEPVSDFIFLEEYQPRRLAADNAPRVLTRQCSNNNFSRPRPKGRRLVNVSRRDKIASSEPVRPDAD